MIFSVFSGQYLFWYRMARWVMMKKEREVLCGFLCHQSRLYLSHLVGLVKSITRGKAELGLSHITPTSSPVGLRIEMPLPKLPLHALLQALVTPSQGVS